MSDKCKWCGQEFNHALCGSMSCDCQETCPCKDQKIIKLKADLAEARQAIFDAAVLYGGSELKASVMREALEYIASESNHDCPTTVHLLGHLRNRAMKALSESAAEPAPEDHIGEANEMIAPEGDAKQ